MKHQKHQLHGFHTEKRKQRELLKEKLKEESEEVQLVLDNIASALGGYAALTPQQKVLLDLLGMDLVLLCIARGFFLEDPSHILNRRKRAFTPLVGEQLRVSAHLQSVLMALGLERKPQVIESLASIIASRPRPETRTEAQG